MHPQRARDMAVSMLDHQEQSAHGLLPIWSLMGNEGWCMTGYHAVSVLADALDAGLDLDGNRVLEAMAATSTVPYLEGLGDYMEKGYVPLEASANGASVTLEYAYDDWTIARTAQRLGQDSLAAAYFARSQNYRNLFDGKWPCWQRPESASPFQRGSIKSPGSLSNRRFPPMSETSPSPSSSCC